MYIYKTTTTFFKEQIGLRANFILTMTNFSNTSTNQCNMHQ